MERTQIRCGIEIPAYVNLKLYDYGFYTTITFHIDESMIKFLTEDCANRKISNGKVFVFAKRNSRGNFLYYYCIRRNYTNLNLIHDACYRVANYDKLRMMQIMRLAKIDAIYNQIDNIEHVSQLELPF